MTLAGKAAVITGATSGIGLATATELAGKGVFVIGTGRSESKCRQAYEIVKETHPEAKIIFLNYDLSSLRQVRELASEIKKQLATEGRQCLDVLVNNAGTVSSWYTSTIDGYELQFAVNHLAPFLLTHILLPVIKAAPAGRVITVSSGSHFRTRIHWKDVFMRKHYNCLMAYKQSKLANVLFTAELNRRLGPGSNVRAFAIDPGLVNTDIGLKGTGGFVRWFWAKRSNRGDEPEKPAKCIAFLAGEPSVQSTEHYYWKDCMPLKPSRYAQNTKAAARLWDLSAKLCGINE